MYEIKWLTAGDQTAAWRMGSLAFGYHDRDMPEGWTSDTPGRHTLGLFDADGTLVAKAVDREQGQWFGGRVVPTSGIAGVVVLPELRGRGLLRQLLPPLLRHARERGAVISTLFPSTPFPYRSLGWEEVGALTFFALPTANLASAKASPAVTLRPATDADEPAIRRLYTDVARASTGLMDREPPLFAGNPVGAFDGLTMAVDADGTPVGYASWNRGPRYDESGKVTVYDLIGATRQATDTLLAMFATWASVAPTTVLRLSTPDPAWLTINQAGARVDSRNTWMLRIVDAAGAVAARGWPEHLDTQIDLYLSDPECPWNEGPARLVLAGGQGKLEPGGTGELRLTPRGLALWYAGAASTAIIERAGLLSGGSSGTHRIMDSAAMGPQPALLDYF
ncbi:GNAT family N-acetyltransferase [Allorhizocola rhizosphaerae]|uniref:GNAT family N-acetyltransferase n=1 Tax=Allorhizocola rhizosphaerae TaxID=1872709 RepID=UPI000E3BDBA9|nr:GNAT family N-acetyltransferase [Allorhizocola rhizosphaerae]